MPKDEVERVQDRLTRARSASEPYFAKVHRLRELVTGNPEALNAAGLSADQTETEVKRRNPTRFSDIFVTDIEEGRDNTLLQTIRTLCQQTTYSFPEVEAQDLEFEEANLHAEYFRQRLGPSPVGCDAVYHVRESLYDYMIGGFGWIWIGMQKGKPVIRNVDTLDCLWDQSAQTVAGGRWWSCTMYDTLKAWQSMFGVGKFDKYIKERNPDPDSPLELQFYYDIETDAGAWKVLFKTGSEEVDNTPVFAGKNPCYWDYGGQRVPFLPAESMFFMRLPSVRLPIGLTEQMLPSQIALWRIQKTIREIGDCPAFYWWRKGALDAAEKQKFEDGKVGGGIEVAEGSDGIHQERALDIPPGLMQEAGMHRQSITAQGGANPYAAGAPVEGTTYAAEVNAIQQNAGLMAGTIAKEHSDFWLRILSKFLAKGAAYDEWPLVTRHEKVTLTFAEADPIKAYLNPDARFVIRENSMQYEDQQARIAKATMALNLALLVQQIFPNAVKEAYQNFLQAIGESNTEKYMAPPEPPPMALPGGAEGQVMGGGPMALPTGGQSPATPIAAQ